MKTRALHRQSGLTLIEVLVAILIFSFGLLGLVGLQVRAVQYSVSAEDSNRAALLANEIAWLRVVTPKTEELPEAAVSEWEARVGDTTGSGLPNGNGKIELLGGAAGNVWNITIEWQAPGAIGGTPNSKNRYVTQVILP